MGRMTDGSTHGRFPGEAAWSVETIHYDALDRERVSGDERFFHILAAASFIEITTDLYTRNLIEFFEGDDEVVGWLTHGWEPEELQHGAALKRYVQTAWPDFDWEGAYRAFYADYSRLCVMELLAPSQALEMVARCVVETGTASFYRTIAEVSAEPVLQQLAHHIHTDEVRHYKHFYQYFRRYQEIQHPSRTAVLRTLLRRMSEVNAEDAFFAFKHVHLTCHPGASFGMRDYKAMRDAFRRLAKPHFPFEMATKMLLKPLGLAGPVGRVVFPAITSATRQFF